MNIWITFLVVIFAGLIHASFHLSVSVLTLLSGHTLSREKSHLKLLKLLTSFVFGAIFMTTILICGAAFILQGFNITHISSFLWMILVGLLVGTGLSVWLFYYTYTNGKKTGTEIWIPRNFAKFLNERARKTKHTAEAFSLGTSSVISEIIFILAPMLCVLFLIIDISPIYQLAAIALYAFTANLPTILIACLIGGGHTIAQIQIWRENNKRFLQFASGSGLIILAIFIYVFEVIPRIYGGSL